MQSLVLFSWLVVCAAQDIRQRHISNGLTLGGALLALVYLLWTGQTWIGATAAQGGWALLVAVALTLPGYALGRMGAGDVKLMAALGLASDPLHVLGTFIGAGVASFLWLLIVALAWPHISPGLKLRLRHLDPQASGKYAFGPFALLGMAFMKYWIH